MNRVHTPLKLYRTDQIRQLERLAIEQECSAIELMQRAGQAAFQALLAQWPLARSLLIVCGKGNNAGDGYVVAKLAQKKGLQVTMRYLGKLQDLPEAAAWALAAAKESGVEDIKPFDSHETLQTDVVIDALLGIGIKGEVQGDYFHAIQYVNAQKKPILSIDVPSGLNADTGQIAGIAVKATLTLTFIAFKCGLFTSQAGDYLGILNYSDLGLPAALLNQIPPTSLTLDWSSLSSLLQPRPRDTHKGFFGHVLVIGGNKGMAGAVRMAGEAAARVGAGLISIATQPNHADFIAGFCPELMCHGIKTAIELEALLERCTVIAIGAGLGQDEWAEELFFRGLQSLQPKIVDADGLNILAKYPTHREDWILTPHPGEAARLLNCSIAEIQADRFLAVEALQQRYGGIIVLKGAGSLIQAPSNLPRICLAGNPGMASGGMGDVLGGVLAGLLAQKLSLENAAYLGVLLHSTAGDKAAAEKGERGLLASDLMPYIRALANKP